MKQNKHSLSVSHDPWINKWIIYKVINTADDHANVQGDLIDSISSGPALGTVGKNTCIYTSELIQGSICPNIFRI